MANNTSIGHIVDQQIKRTYLQLTHDLAALLCYEHHHNGECNHDYCDGISMAIKQIGLKLNG